MRRIRKVPFKTGTSANAGTYTPALCFYLAGLAAAYIVFHVKGNTLTPFPTMSFPGNLWYYGKFFLAVFIFSFSSLGAVAIPALTTATGFNLAGAAICAAAANDKAEAAALIIKNALSAAVFLAGTFTLSVYGFENSKRLFLKLIGKRNKPGVPGFAGNHLLRFFFFAAALTAAAAIEYIAAPYLNSLIKPL